MSKKTIPVKPAGQKKIIKVLYSTFLLVLIILSVLNLVLYFNKKPQTVYGSEVLKNSKIMFWEQMVTAYPDYFEGWIELAKLQIIEKEYIAAKEAFLKAKRINPNSEKIEELSKQFTGN